MQTKYKYYSVVTRERNTPGPNNPVTNNPKYPTLLDVLGRMHLLKNLLQYNSDVFSKQELTNIKEELSELEKLNELFRKNL